MLQRACPDAAREHRAAAPLHDLEELGVGAVSVQLARPPLQRLAPGVGLEAPVAAAGALRAVLLHDHVADLAGRSAAGPRLALQDQAAADARATEHAEERRVAAA